MPDDQTIPELPPFDAAEDVLPLLRAGSRLVRCLPEGWRLEPGGVAVADTAVNVLMRGGQCYFVGVEPVDWGGGTLVGLGDGLLPEAPSQTYIWTEHSSHARH